LANFSANNVNLSDRREKTNFAPAGDYLTKNSAIPVQTFNYIDQNMEEDDGLTLGVVAQDVQTVAPELVMESDWSSKKDGSKMRLSIYQTDLQYALMKSIQELKALVDGQAVLIATQASTITALQADVASLKGTP
jgi:2-polyprenyl-6-methoxyphenol hydroxylase-like FAD-dependent oxidoreductase